MYVRKGHDASSGFAHGLFHPSGHHTCKSEVIESKRITCFGQELCETHGRNCQIPAPFEETSPVERRTAKNQGRKRAPEKPSRHSKQNIVD